MLSPATAVQINAKNHNLEKTESTTIEISSDEIFLEDYSELLEEKTGFGFETLLEKISGINQDNFMVVGLLWIIP